jgi:cation diffusion facilitator CzcD-associated flavoprotein CzcO
MLHTATSKRVRRIRLAIIGSGFAGLAAAIRIKQSGDDDFVVLERASDLGGVWRDNRYPGCACDVESHLYSLSSVPNPEWSRQFSSQPEILAYLKQCAREAGVLPHIRFSTNVDRMAWDEMSGEWLIETSQGDYRARFVVAAMGSLNDPLIPDLKGLEGFRGQAFHSSRWPQDIDLNGKSIAVVGTGASAVQYIPTIQPHVAALHIFQRTAPWVMPRHDTSISAETQYEYRSHPWRLRLERLKLYIHHEMLAFLFRHPAIMRALQRGTLKHMEGAVSDPELRRKLTPNYTLGCKRILFSNDYYPALTQPNVHLIATGATEVTPTGVVGGDGVERPADVIIFGTGFRINDPAYAHFITGTDGRSLAQAWEGSPKTLAGTTVHGFPNLFLLNGPNVGQAYTSVILMVEAQIEHALSAMRYAERRDRAIIEPRADAQQRFTSWIDRQMRGTVWAAGGCKSWYLDGTGRISALWPSYTFTFRRRVTKIRPAEYEVRQAPVVVPHADMAVR